MENLEELVPKLKAIIFDLDGVLIDSMPYHAKAWQKAFKEFGIKIEKEKIYELEGENEETTVKTIFKEKEKAISKEVIEKISNRKEAITEEILEVNTFENIELLLKKLSEKYELALVSGSNREFVEEIVKEKFQNLFSVILTGDEIESKPSPSPYSEAVKELEVNKKEALVVENAPLGVKSSIKAGIKCVVVPTYLPKKVFRELSENEKCIWIFDSHEKLRRFLLNLINEDILKILRKVSDYLEEEGYTEEKLKEILSKVEESIEKSEK